MFYFAYGSNMDKTDLTYWCKKNFQPLPDMKFLCTAELKDYKLSFNYYSSTRKGGAANIMKREGSKIYGYLFEISNQDRETMRVKEGYPSYYTEIIVDVSSESKTYNNVITYKVIKDKELPVHQPPTRQYIDLILNNGRRKGFPSDYITYLEGIEIQN